MLFGFELAVAAPQACPASATALGHNPLFAKAAKQAHEHRFAFDGVVKAVKPRFGYVRHHVPVRTKDVISERPSDEIPIRNALEVVLVDHLIPQRMLLGHVLNKRNRLRIADRHVEYSGNLWPD